MNDLEQLAKAIHDKNTADDEIAHIIGRPALIGHTGEYIAASIFSISLEQSAAHKGIDGRFTSGNLAGKTVNIKWYPKMESLLDISPQYLPDFYLVMAGPKAPAISSRGTTRPWLIDYVFLFDAARLVENLKSRGIKIGIATSITKQLWQEAEIYPTQRNNQLILSEEQKRSLALFGAN